MSAKPNIPERRRKQNEIEGREIFHRIFTQARLAVVVEPSEDFTRALVRLRLPYFTGHNNYETEFGSLVLDRLGNAANSRPKERTMLLDAFCKVAKSIMRSKRFQYKKKSIFQLHANASVAWHSIRGLPDRQSAEIESAYILTTRYKGQVMNEARRNKQRLLESKMA